MKNLAISPKTITKNLVISIMFLVLAGCSVSSFLPMPGNYTIEEGFAILRTDSLQVVVRPQSYRGSNRDIGNKFFSMYVMVRNISNGKIRIPRESFSIVSDAKQYDYIPLDFVLGSQQQQLYLDQWQDPFNPDPLITDELERNLDQYYELMAAYFSFGDLQPGASKEGYLFYGRELNRARHMVFDALGEPIQFIR